MPPPQQNIIKLQIYWKKSCIVLYILQTSWLFIILTISSFKIKTQNESIIVSIIENKWNE